MPFMKQFDMVHVNILTVRNVPQYYPLDNPYKGPVMHLSDGAILQAQNGTHTRCLDLPDEHMENSVSIDLCPLERLKIIFAYSFY